MTIPSLYQHALAGAVQQVVAALYPDTDVAVEIEKPKIAEHGDFTCTVAMPLARLVKKPPMEIGEALAEAIALPDFIADCVLHPPGFINFRIADDAKRAVIDEVLQAGDDYGRCAPHQRGVLVEFVSANPTGPLHIGHGRGAVFGDCLCRLLQYTGYQVQREYYVNDAGVQIDILAASAWLRYHKRRTPAIRIPEDGYQGDYLDAVAEAVFDDDMPALDTPPETIEQAISACRESLGARYDTIKTDVCTRILDDIIKPDLESLGVSFHRWFSEKTLHEDGAVEAQIERLIAQQPDLFYEHEDALWCRTQEFGDDKDRVVRRADGRGTYFAADIAYHADKFRRIGAEAADCHLIDILGADHHGYVSRLESIAAALGYRCEQMETLLIQFASLVRDGEKIPMSTRAGKFYTLTELINDAGVDAVRYFFISKRNDQHLEFDLDLARAESKDNPVYYIQYAHARICSLFNKAREAGFAPEAAVGNAEVLKTLTQPGELDLCMLMQSMPEVLYASALARTPHRLAGYLLTLAHAFHQYYTSTPILSEDNSAAQRQARLALCLAVQQTLRVVLQLLGIRALEKM